jgi:hypothetical protein
MAVHSNESSDTAGSAIPTNNRRLNQFIGSLSAAIRPGANYKELRQVIELGESQRYPVSAISAKLQAHQAKIGVSLPTYAEPLQSAAPNAGA